MESILVVLYQEIFPGIYIVYVMFWRHAKGLHFRLDILEQGLQLVHVCGLLWPSNSQAFFLVRLGDLETVGGYHVRYRWPGEERDGKRYVPCGNEPATKNRSPLASLDSATGLSFKITHMLNHLMRRSAIVLENVVLGGSGSLHQLLSHGLLNSRQSVLSQSLRDRQSIPESRSGARPGCRQASRRGTWG
jgi:hypothetical protein